MKQLADLIKASAQIIVFTGAGMSTESGLPDFRSNKQGLWKKFNPDELANVNALLYNVEEFTNFYRYRLSAITNHQPHEGHKILAKWEREGLINGIITQNVDGFHHDAGSKNVMELHGTFRSFHCHKCKQKQDRDAYLAGETTCSCGGVIRPGIVLFGESLPQDTFQQAEEESLRSDLFIVLGSSLSVTPANMFPLLAKDANAKLVIINWEPTQLDMYADIVIQERSIKEVLNEVDQLL